MFQDPDLSTQQSYEQIDRSTEARDLFRVLSHSLGDVGQALRDVAGQVITMQREIERFLSRSDPAIYRDRLHHHPAPFANPSTGLLDFVGADSRQGGVENPESSGSGRTIQFRNYAGQSLQSLFNNSSSSEQASNEPQAVLTSQEVVMESLREARLEVEREFLRSLEFLGYRQQL